MAYDALVTYLNDHLGGSNAAIQLLEHMSTGRPARSARSTRPFSRTSRPIARLSRASSIAWVSRARSVMWAAGSPRRRIG